MRVIRGLRPAEDTSVAVSSSNAFASGPTVQQTIKDGVFNVSTNALTLSAFSLNVTLPLNSAYLTGPIAYSSSDPATATVDQSGTVTPLKIGTVTITATVPGLRNRKFVLNIVQSSGQNTSTFVNWAAGSLGAHLAAQVTGLIGSTPNPAPGLSTVTDPPSRATYGNLFMYTAFQGATRNAGVWTGALDTSCIPNNPSILVAPDIVLYATHVGTPGFWGNTIQFIDMAGTVHTATFTFTTAPDGTRTSSHWQHPIAGLTGDADITMIRLDAPLPASVKPVKVLPANYASYLPQPQYGYPMLVSNQDRTMLLADLTSFERQVLGPSGTTIDIEVEHSADATRSQWFYPVRPGDSGTPAFVVINGELVLTNLWHYTGEYGPNYADNISAINAAMTALGSAYQLTTPDLSGFPTY